MIFHSNRWQEVVTRVCQHAISDTLVAGMVTWFCQYAGSDRRGRTGRCPPAPAADAADADDDETPTWTRLKFYAALHREPHVSCVSEPNQIWLTCLLRSFSFPWRQEWEASRGWIPPTWPPTTSTWRPLACWWWPPTWTCWPMPSSACWPDLPPFSFPQPFHSLMLLHRFLGLFSSSHRLRMEPEVSWEKGTERPRPGTPLTPLHTWALFPPAPSVITAQKVTEWVLMEVHCQPWSSPESHFQRRESPTSKSPLSKKGHKSSLPGYFC